MFPHVSNIKWAPSHASKHRPCCQPFPRESLLSDSHSLAKSSNLCLWTPITRLIVKGDISDNTGHYIINYIYIHIMWYPYILYSSFTLSFWCKQSLQLSVCELKFIVAVCVCVSAFCACTRAFVCTSKVQTEWCPHSFHQGQGDGWYPWILLLGPFLPAPPLQAIKMTACHLGNTSGRGSLLYRCHIWQYMVRPLPVEQLNNICLPKFSIVFHFQLSQ